MKILVYVIPSEAAFLNHHLPLAIAAANSYRVHLVVPNTDHNGKTLAGEGILAGHGITVHRLPLTRSSANPFRVWREARSLRRLFQRLRPDLINAINLKAVLVSALANQNSSCPLVGTIPGLGYLFSGESPRQRVLSEVAILALRAALSGQRHLLVMSNRDDAGEFQRRRVTRGEGICVVPVPGVDTERFSPVPEPAEGYRVVLAGRMLREKGVEEFVQAGRILAAKIPGAEFIMAGTPDPGNPSSIERRRLEQWAREGAVSWLGDCADMPGFLASSHVVCLPSTYREGFPRILAEAMASGRAVVTTDMPGCREVGREAGLIIPPGDTIRLAEALYRLWERPGERQALGRAGRARALADFAEETISGKMLDCYRYASSL